jgi:hypothetical protein
VSPVSVLIDGNVMLCSRYFVTNQGVLLFLDTGPIVLLPLGEQDARELRDLCAGGWITRIDVNAPFARLH